MAVGNLSNTRMLRSLLILIFIIVTIFIYALYSTTSFSSELPIPQQITLHSDGQQQKIVPKLMPSMKLVQLNNAGEFGLASDEDEKELIRDPNSVSSVDFSPLVELIKETDSPNINSSTQVVPLHNETMPATTADPKGMTTPQMMLETQDPESFLIETYKLYVSGHSNDEIDVERICALNGSNTRLLILITSALEHADERMSIRQTWGHYGARRDIGIAFVLGRGTNESLNKNLTEENYLYGDLIRGNNIDSYNNLTLKVISALEWTDQHCHHTKFLLKTDDDMFINVPILLSFIREQEKRKQKRAIFGRLANKWHPIRNKKSKYYISTYQYPEKVYPAFTTGPAYLLTGDIVHDLYVGSLNSAYLKLEDVFITGFVAGGLEIERIHVYEFLNRRILLTSCNVRKSISVHMIEASEQFDLWQKLQNQTKC